MASRTSLTVPFLTEIRSAPAPFVSGRDRASVAASNPIGMWQTCARRFSRTEMVFRSPLKDTASNWLYCRREEVRPILTELLLGYLIYAFPWVPHPHFETNGGGAAVVGRDILQFSAGEC